MAAGAALTSGLPVPLYTAASFKRSLALKPASAGEQQGSSGGAAVRRLERHASWARKPGRRLAGSAHTALISVWAAPTHGDAHAGPRAARVAGQRRGGVDDPRFGEHLHHAALHNGAE